MSGHGFRDSELAQMDREATLRLQLEDFANRHPEWLLSIVQAPKDLLARAAAKAEMRRYSARPQPLTGFGDLEVIPVGDAVETDWSAFETASGVEQ